MPSKIFCRVLLNRIEGAIDVNLRQEQAGVNRQFSLEVRCTPRMHSITNTVQYNPRLHYEAVYTEYTAWYTVDYVLTIRKPGLCR